MEFSLSMQLENSSVPQIWLLTKENAEQVQNIPVSARHAKKNEVTLWHVDDRVVMTVGLGDATALTSERLRDAMGVAGRKAETEEWVSVAIHRPCVLADDVEVSSIVEGLKLGTYAFDRYQAKRKEHALQYVTVTGTAEELRKTVNQAERLADATAIARDLANEPPNIMRPAVLASYVQQLFADTPAKVTVWADEELSQRQMVGLLAVGKGSIHGPRFIQIEYVSNPSKPRIALVGKGITFDTGGISLKTSRDFSNMRMDMAGGAAVIGAMHALVQLGVPCNVVGLIAAAENVPDAGCMLPGELIAYPNGVSVQVINTDAEGRLVLADALIHAGTLGAQQIVDIATLTGAAAAALGDRYAAIFGHDDIVQAVTEAGNQAGDAVWRLPLVDEYEKQLDSVYADIANVGSGQGAIIAALFLRKFVPGTAQWAHVDMAGPMEATKTSGYRPAGATGYGARLLAQFVMLQR